MHSPGVGLDSMHKRSEVARSRRTNSAQVTAAARIHFKFAVQPPLLSAFQRCSAAAAQCGKREWAAREFYLWTTDGRGRVRTLEARSPVAVVPSSSSSPSRSPFLPSSRSRNKVPEKGAGVSDLNRDHRVILFLHTKAPCILHALLMFARWRRALLLLLPPILLSPYRRAFKRQRGRTNELRLVYFNWSG